MKWAYGQLHEDQRALGCQDLYAVFKTYDNYPNVKHTVAENVTMDEAIAIQKLPQMANEIVDIMRFLKNAMQEHENKTAQEFSDGYYSSALAAYNRMHLLNQIAEEVRELIEEK